MKINTIVKTLLLTTALSGSAYAAIPGLYLGAGAGYNSMRDFTDANTTNAGGLGGTLVVGYNFNEYIGLEGSYRQFTDTNYQLENSRYNFDISMHSFNLVTKFYAPLGQDNKFNLYGFIGASNVHTSTDMNYNGYYYNYNNLYKDSNSAILATAGFGIDYTVSPNVTIGVEYAGTQAKDGDDVHIGIPGTNMVNAMLAYHFN